MNVIWPILIQAMTALLIVLYIFFYRRHFKNDHSYNGNFFLPNSPKASSKGAVPITTMMLFSLGDQIQACLSAPPAPFVSLPVQSVMSNLVLMWTALTAYFWIHTRYSQTHIIGVLLILVAILVQFGPYVTTNDCSDHGLRNGLCFASYKDSQGNFVKLSGAAMLCWYFLFGISFLPAAVGNVYKQKILQARDDRDLK